MLRSVKIICKPLTYDSRTGAPQTRQRDFYKVDLFGKKLADSLRMTVDVVEQDIASVLSQGILVWYVGADVEFILKTLDTRGSKDVFRRIILISTGGNDVRDIVRDWKLAGGISTKRYFSWTEHPERETGGVLLGLRFVAQQMGASTFGQYLTKDDPYAFVTDDQCGDLTSLLARYISFFWKTIIDENH